MNATEIKRLQTTLGVVADGFFGPKSIAAVQRHLKSLMPSPSPWPGTTQRNLSDFYGAPGVETNLINLDVSDLDIRYELVRVKTIRCHKKVAESLKRVLVSLSKTHPQVLRDYNGCYNNRKMRGGALPSLHARGAAIDFCAAANGNLSSWPHRALMPLEVMEAFAREGWTPAGAFWGRDAMHFQATKI